MSPRNRKRPKKLTPQQRVATRVIAGFLAVCLLAGVAVAGWAGVRIHHAWTTSHWPSVIGEVIRSSVRQRADHTPPVHHGVAAGTWTYEPEITYCYTVEGTEYTASGVTATRVSTSRSASAESVVARYPVGRRVKVHYNPADPGEALLEPGLSWTATAPLLFAGLAFCVVPIALGVPVVRRLRDSQPRRRPTAAGTAPPGLPRDSGIRELEASPARVVLHLPAGRTGVSTTGWLGAIGVGLGLFYAAFFLPDLFVAGARWSLRDIVLTSGFGGAGVAGIALLAWWVRLKYESTRLQADAEELRIERRLGPLRRGQRIVLAPGARAELVHHHDDNGAPVFAVGVAGASPQPVLGVTLEDAEKTWLVDRLNALIAPEAGPCEFPTDHRPD
ncbi:MAG: DUF3592 domain-containing protein [Phycisphaerales bacterium]|nr:DUF3592 domain-containing protein [Phycisphaerales bacterium]